MAYNMKSIGCLAVGVAAAAVIGYLGSMYNSHANMCDEALARVRRMPRSVEVIETGDIIPDEQLNVGRIFRYGPYFVSDNYTDQMNEDKGTRLFDMTNCRPVAEKIIQQRGLEAIANNP